MSIFPIVVIYVIENTLNGKKYVGSTKNSVVRISDHFWALNRDRHANPHLQRDWKKYGEAAFKHYVVDRCAEQLRWRWEQRWIDKYDTCSRKFGYNLMFPTAQLAPCELSKRLKKYWGNRWQDPSYAKRRTEELKKIATMPGVRASMSKAKLNSWADPAYREKMVEKHKRYANKPKNKRRLRHQVINAWANPEYREKQLAERAKRFADPAFREKLSVAAQNRKSKKFVNR